MARFTCCRSDGSEYRAAAAARSAHAADVLPHRLRFAPDLVQAVLDHVADADVAAEPSVMLDHRDVTDPLVGHQRHDRAHPVLPGTGEYLARHHAADALAEHRAAPVGERVHDPALRDDPGNARLVV